MPSPATVDQSLPLRDGALSIEGAVSVEQTATGAHPWRLPVADRALYEPSMVLKASMPAGVRLAFTSDTGNVALQVERAPDVDEDPPWVFDLLVDGTLHQRVAPPQDTATIGFTDLPAGEHRVEIYLPSQYVPLTVRGVQIDRGASAARWSDERQRIVFYGSSITHCRHAAGPSETWPALVARRFDLHLTSLGFGGDCHMEPMVGRLIRDLPAAAIGLKLGINMMGAASASDRLFRALVLGLLATIRDGHPDTPIAVVSPICHPPNEATPNAVEMTLELMRRRLAEAVALLRERGDRNLCYVDGLELMGPQDVHLYADGIHPSADGYRFLADAYCRVVMPQLGLSALGGSGG